MKRRNAIVPLLLLPVLFAVGFPGWAKDAEDEIQAIRIFHPDGKEAASFVRSRHVAVGSLGDMKEQDGVLVCDLHHPHYNFTFGGAFIETFKVIKPTDDQVLANFTEYRDVLLIESTTKPGHWEVAGLKVLCPKDPQQDKAGVWLPASFDHMDDAMLVSTNYRYEGFVKDNLEALKSEDAKTRSRAMFLLGVIDPGEDDAAKVIDVLAGLIGSDDPGDRSSAVSAVGEIGGQHAERYVPRIAELLDGKLKERSGVQIAAISAICQIGGKEAQKNIPRIIELMQNKPDLTHPSIYWLGEMGGQAASALPDLLDALKAVDKNDRNMVEVIIMAMGKIAPSDPKVIDALTPLLDHESSFVRELSKNALDGRYFERPAPENVSLGIQ